jgi:hypothetical protein
VLPLSPNPGLTGGVHDGAGAGSGVGAIGAGFRTGAAFLTGAVCFGAAFFAGRFAARFAGFRAADFATFFFFRAGAAFFLDFVDFFALAFFDFFAMISPPDPSYEYENPIGPIGGRVHATIPTSSRQPAAADGNSAACPRRSCNADGQGPPLAQSINSTVWTVGTLVPAAI